MKDYFFPQFSQLVLLPSSGSFSSPAVLESLGLSVDYGLQVLAVVAEELGQPIPLQQRNLELVGSYLEARVRDSIDVFLRGAVFRERDVTLALPEAHIGS